MNVKYLIPVALLSAWGTFSSCSSEDDLSAVAGQPLVLYADMTLTRSTVDSQWTLGDSVALEIGGVVKQYEITDASTGKLEASAGVEPFRWTSASDSFDATAWSLGGSFQETLPTSLTIPQYQHEEGYDSADLLYAKGTLTPSASSLTFYHQLAKVTVYARVTGDWSTVTADDFDAYLGHSPDLCPLTATFTAPSDGNYGTWSNYTGEPDYAIYMQPGTIESGSDYTAVFTALLLPKDYSNTQFIQIEVMGDIVWYYTPATGEANLQAGHSYTYYITACDDELNVIVESDEGTSNTVTPWAP